MFCDIKALQRDTQNVKENKHLRRFPGLPAKHMLNKRGVRTITTFSKDPRKGVCHPVDIFQKETSVFLPDFQTRIFFFSFNSHFNPAAILSEALQHSQRHQLNKFLSCGAIWLTKPLVNQLTCLKPPHSRAL